ncbi:MAG: ABC transporter substrate-binding protein [Salinirussus sp.]
MSRRLRRRDVIRGIGAAGMIGLAGCGGGGDGGDGGDGGGDTATEASDGDGGGDAATETEAGEMTTTESGMSGRTLRMGLLMGVTGGLAELGPPIRNAAALVPKQVNEADTPFSVETQFEDTATDPTQGISGAEALVNAGYPMVCGALSSEVTIQTAKNVFIPSGVTQCSPASTSPAITGLNDNDLVYRTPPTDRLQGVLLARIASERLNASSASTLFLNNAYGQGLASGFADAFANQFNGTITAEVSFAEGKSSYTSNLQEALADDPDTMLIVGYPASGVQIFRDFYSNFDRPDMPILVPDGLQSQDLPGNVGRDMSNVQGTAPAGEGPGLDFFKQQYTSTYDVKGLGPFTKQSYDAAAVLLLANAAAGENDGAAVAENMRAVANPEGETVTSENLVEGIEMAASGTEINYQGVAGPIEFDENGDQATATYEYFEYSSDGYSVVETISP